MSTATLSRAPGLARAAAEKQAAADRQFTAATSERQARETAQGNHATQIKLERLARREPMVARLLDEHTALQASLAALRQKHDQHVAAATEVVTDNARLRQENEILGARNLELGRQVASLEVEVADLKRQLAERALHAPLPAKPGKPKA